MKPFSRLSSAVFAACSVCLPAKAYAHLVNTNVGEFYAGMMHPVTSSAHLLPILALALILLHFVLPFFLLLSRWSKRRVRILTTIAAFIFVMQLLAIFWLIMPAFYPQGFHLHWLDLVTPVAIGGLWLAFFVWQLKKKSLLPLHDPRFQEVPAYD